MSSLRIGNVYGHGFDRDQRARLEASGFTFRDEVSRCAGSQSCSFIDFPDGPSLELIEVTDRGDYESFVPAGMEPYCPGISLVVEDGSPASLDAYEREFADLDPYRLHVGYRNADDPAAPGWHYLNFARAVVPGTFVWLTAFDEPVHATQRPTDHANGVLGMVGLAFEKPTPLQSFARLAAATPGRHGLDVGGVKVLAIDWPGVPRRFPLRAVVLRAGSLAAFGRPARSAALTRRIGRPVARIETNPLSWELWVTV